MNKIDFLKLKSLLKIQKEVQPKTYLGELAESGMLDEYLNDIFKDKIEKDSDFRDKIYEAYFKYSTEVNENLELYYLESICESLSFFIEFTGTCRTPKQ